MPDEIISTEQYRGIERRKYAKTTEQLEVDIRNMLKEHEEKQLKVIEGLRNDLLGAFPDGDVEGHCTYHMNKIQAAKAEEEFWKTAKQEAIKNGVSGMFAVLKIVFGLALVGLAYKLGIGPAVAKMLGA